MSTRSQENSTVGSQSTPLTCREMGLTDIDSAILMRNITRAFISAVDDQRGYEQARYQHRTRRYRDAKRARAEVARG